MEEFATLYLHGTSEKAIAVKFDLSQSQVSKDLTAYFGRFAAGKDQEDLESLMGRELARLDLVERELWQAWYASKTPREMRTKESTNHDAGSGCKTASKRGKVSLRVERRDGNPAFLNAILACFDRRCKLLGLYSDAVRERLCDREVKPIQVIEVREVAPGGARFDDCSSNQHLGDAK